MSQTRREQIDSELDRLRGLLDPRKPEEAVRIFRSLHQLGLERRLHQGNHLMSRHRPLFSKKP